VKLLVDGDLIAYPSAASCEKRDKDGNILSLEDEHIALWRCGATINNLKERWKTDDVEIFISGDNNFRYTIWPEYKANRRGVPRPVHLIPAQEYLVLEHGARVTDGYEADDALGIRQSEVGPSDCIVCSLDKDLRQLEGRHYNWVKDEDTIVSKWLGDYTFYRHVLLGDKADNILRSPELAQRRLGPVRLDKILEGCESEVDLYTTARDLYANDEWFFRNCRLVYILRSEGDEWRPPVATQQETRVKPTSSPVTEMESDLWWEHTTQELDGFQPVGSPMDVGQKNTKQD